MRQQNRQAVTKIGIVRRLRDAEPETFSDGRSRRGRRYDHHTLIWSLMLGCVGGLASLREVEALTAGLRPDVRRTTGIDRRRSDTKLRDVLLRALALSDGRSAESVGPSGDPGIRP